MSICSFVLLYSISSREYIKFITHVFSYQQFWLMIVGWGSAAMNTHARASLLDCLGESTFGVTTNLFLSFSRWYQISKSAVLSRNLKNQLENPQYQETLPL